MGRVSEPGLSRVTLYEGYRGANFRVPSATGSSTYTVSFEGERGYCQCRHAKQHGGVMNGYQEWCRHVLSANGNAMRQQVEFLRARLAADRGGENNWGDFHAVVDGVLAYRKEDQNLVATAFLLAAYSQGEACADDVHELVGDRIEGDPRIIGIVIGSLLQRGIIRKTGSKNSKRRATNHGREIKSYALTKEGNEVLVGLVLEKSAQVAS